MIYATPLLPERLWTKVHPTADGHWLWTGYVMSNGYGQAARGGRDGMQLAHRLFYERLVGPIPIDKEIDHVCRVKNCVNPAHLEAVTHLENVRRVPDPGRVGSDAAAVLQLSKTHCPRGHEYSGDNLQWDSCTTRANKKRRCRECKRANRKASYARNRERINAQRRALP